MTEPVWDFMISCAIEDIAWGRRIASRLAAEGFRAVLLDEAQHQSSHYAELCAQTRRRCKKVLAIMSLTGLESPEEEFWQTVCSEDPSGSKQQFIPVKLEPCQPRGILGPIIAIELSGMSQSEALTFLVRSLKNERSAPRFPG